jgi:hypothetical protein
MTILILHRGPLRSMPYHLWFAEYPGDLLLLADRADAEAECWEPPPGAYRHVEFLDHWDTGGLVEDRAIHLARQHLVTNLVARHERDLQRAAQLREVLRLPGQDRASADAFRDKVVMKTAAAAAGLAVAPYTAVEEPVDALRFMRERGLPVVIKPRTGAGSKDNWILNTPEGLIDVLDGALTPYWEAHPNLLIESFVPGAMYHIDGLFLAGEPAVAWPSHYLDPLAEYRSGRSRLDVALDPEDPFTARLLEFTRRMLAALPTPRDCAFHLEVFRTLEDDIVLCEIASRSGGAAIRTMWKVMFDIDLVETSVRAQVGLLRGEIVQRTPRVIAGQLLVMKRAGCVRAIPDRLPFEGVENYRANVAVGDTIEAPTFSGDVAAIVVMSGPSQAECERRLREARDWFDEHFVVE